MGRLFALACGRAGADVIIHHGHSPKEAESVKEEIASFGPRAWVLASDLSQPESGTQLIDRASELSPLYGLVNSASIFEPLTVHDTSLDDWNQVLGSCIRAEHHRQRVGVGSNSSASGESVSE